VTCSQPVRGVLVVAFFGLGILVVTQKGNFRKCGWVTDAVGCGKAAQKKLPVGRAHRYRKHPLGVFESLAYRRHTLNG
jgi:hypothetical protein